MITRGLSQTGVQDEEPRIGPAASFIEHSVCIRVLRHVIRLQGKTWAPEEAAPGLDEAQPKAHGGEELAAT